MWSISFDGNELNVIDVQKQSEMIVHICKGDVSSWNKASNVECVSIHLIEIMLKKSHGNSFITCFLKGSTR